MFSHRSPYWGPRVLMFILSQNAQYVILRQDIKIPDRLKVFFLWSPKIKMFFVVMQHLIKILCCIFLQKFLYVMQIHRSSQNLPPPVTRFTFLYLETSERPFEKNRNYRSSRNGLKKIFFKIFFASINVDPSLKSQLNFRICCFLS